MAFSISWMNLPPAPDADFNDADANESNFDSSEDSSDSEDEI